jgi:hypothetical protein
MKFQQGTFPFHCLLICLPSLLNYDPMQTGNASVLLLHRQSLTWSKGHEQYSVKTSMDEQRYGKTT